MGNWGMRFGLALGWFGWANRQVHEEQSRHSLAQGWPEQELPQPGISPTHSRTPPILTSLLSLLLFIIILHEVREPSWPRLHCWGPIGFLQACLMVVKICTIPPIMAQNNPEWRQCMSMTQRNPNGPWGQVTQNGPNWPKLAQNGPNWRTGAQKGPTSP